MVLDSKLETLRNEFNIQKPEDWCKVSPASIVAVKDIGDQTLNHLRLMLANRGLTLANDETPIYWQTNLDALRGASQIASSDKAIVCPFTVLVDSDEKQPFTFTGIRADANKQHRPLIIRTASKHLGNSHGDYSIEGLEGWVHIERKAESDVQGTVLGWGDRRDRFVRTLEYLAELPSSAVIVECTLLQAITSIRDTPNKTAKENQKIFYRQVVAWMDDYRVPWVFCDDRRFAEVTTFRWLERQWRKRTAEAKRTQIDAAKNPLFELNPGL
jgi:hypothetical protein